MSTRTTAAPTPATDDRMENRATTFAKLVGAAFLVVGILGFIPGITSHFGDIKFAGEDSDAKLLGLFQVSVLHNIVHLLFGIAGLAAARAGWRAARAFLFAGGAIYLVLWLYGLVIEKASDSNFVPLNRADDWLHFILGLGMLALGALAAIRHDRYRTTS